VIGSTALLLMADEEITKNVRSFSDRIHMQPQETYKDLLKIKLGTTNVSLLKAPQNVNTGLYQIGQGFPSLLIGAGLFTYGKIHNDNRALSTANQLAESFILMGFYTQLLKRISGRQSPSEAPQLEGRWHLLPLFKDFQHHTPNYDAFPSGHLATLMSSVTVLAENYPDSRWIKPLGYSITGLVGYSMINNEVHWASDYPLALALGYLCARQVVKHNRKEAGHEGRISIDHATFTVNYLNGVLLPGLRYTF
jgi:membrane-associated phospholipid phosphatase